MIDFKVYILFDEKYGDGLSVNLENGFNVEDFNSDEEIVLMIESIVYWGCKKSV